MDQIIRLEFPVLCTWKMSDDMEAFTNMLWESLNEDNKVSLFVRYIDIATGETKSTIVNKNK